MLGAKHYLRVNVGDEWDEKIVYELTIGAAVTTLSYSLLSWERGSSRGARPER